ncbi:MAG: tRNA pseudouridine(38-40) synthase TruA [Firmicutes bacterium]|nr:tRNA pseudouridine(38-40) synthase TruA [Bacillota bacterium]MDY5531353.1 tRNA pseudouridine(38-40) synthase TruA [Pumilibacteraceae bacterium]
MIVRITVDYIGTAYHGWQKQKNLDTVQERLETAVKSLTGESVTVHGSGRTDAGVHAFGQVAHFDLEKQSRSYNFVKGLNHFLPPDIRVIDASVERDDFHARFSAHRKTYEYLVYEGKTDRAIYHDRAMRVWAKLDVDKMNRAAKVLEGEHDFASFMSSGSEVDGTVRNLYKLEAERKGELIVITATANGFLYNMVRRLVSVLIKAGKDELNEKDVLALLEALDGKVIKDIVPACGLYLKSVEYPEYRLVATRED